MYIPKDIAARIKLIAESKNIPVRAMLVKLHLGLNTISHMTSRGSFPRCDNLAKIADYLGCSTDYLLGRNESDDKTFEDNLVIFHNKGKIIRKRFTDEQMECIERFIDFISDEKPDY